MPFPTKLPAEGDERWRLAIEMARGPVSNTIIADKLQVTRRQFFSWISKGREGIEPFATFTREYLAARADARIALIDKALKGGKGSAHALWVLERIWPKEFGRAPTQRHELSGPKGKPLAIVLEWPDADNSTHDQAPATAPDAAGGGDGSE